ncbi:hypothetical protein [Promicromonospora iranensis]|nr:hypothetical protein [Promicromonospora iranensis]
MTAGRDVAMGHAAEAVRDATDEVTSTIDEERADAVLASLVQPVPEQSA